MNGLLACSLGLPTCSSLLEFIKVMVQRRTKFVFNCVSPPARQAFLVLTVHLQTSRMKKDLVREAQMARSLGFAGKSCIHPSQIALANRIFSPSSEEIAAAARCLEAARTAADGGEGCVCVGWAHGRCAICKKG